MQNSTYNALRTAIFFAVVIFFSGCNLSDDSESIVHDSDVDDETELDAGHDHDAGESDTGSDQDTGSDTGDDTGDDTGLQCTSGEACGDQCVNLQSDNANCGQCGRTCDNELSCIDGECRCADSSLTSCGGQCVSTDDDPDHCGSCENPCSTGTCEDGECVLGPCDREGEPFGGGDGSSQDPYRICTPQQLLRIGQDDYRSEDFALYRNIDFDDLAGGEFAPIGEGSTTFNGTLEGNDLEIRNLTFGQPSSTTFGLFRSFSGEAQNLRLVGVAIQGNFTIGAFAGENRGLISNISVEGTITATGYDVGGLIGRNEGPGVIFDSSADIEIINPGGNVGGLVGRNRGTISGSTATGTLSSDGGTENAGGLVGLQAESGEVLSCEANVEITIDGEGTNIGGLVGSSNDSSLVRDSSTDATISAPTSRGVGGLVGALLDSSEIVDCHSEADVHGDSNVGGLVGQSGNSPGASTSITGGRATGRVQGTNQVGGLVGSNTGGSITQSSAHGDVIGVPMEGMVGGLFGTSGFYLISESFATGDVSGGSRAGGLGGSVGYGTVSDSYATGDISDADTAGGLIGSIAYGGPRTSYSTGKVDADTAGGLIGMVSSSGSVSDSYWNTTSSGLTESADGEGRNAAAFQNESTFVDWDFDSVWEMSDSEGRPVLRWQ